jgi:hypothetical protein
MSSDTDITAKLEEVLTKALEAEWTAQGHTMNNKIIAGIEYVVKQEAASLTLTGMSYFYGNIIAAGTKPDKIPYSGRSGRGGTSLYIQALQNYVKQRMKITDEKKSLGIAFAIAQTQHKEGMPTFSPNKFNANGSYSFTSTSKRLDWVEEALKHNEKSITEAINEMFAKVLSVELDAVLNKWNAELSKG